jgi:hypothetical protein
LASRANGGRFRYGNRGHSETVMKSLFFIFLASPDFSGSGQAAVRILLLFTLYPMFALNAFNGFSVLSVVLGIFQFLVLCSAEATQWRFTRRAKLPVRVISAIATYIASNLVFSLGFLAVAWFGPNLVSN